MNYVYLSPHFPPFYHPFSTALKELGVNVLGIGDEPYDNLAPALKQALGEYYRLQNMEDYDALYRAMGHFAHRHGRLHRVESHNEYWLETDARLRTDFNIPGFTSETILNVRRKSRMKKVFQKAGVDSARGILIGKDIDARRFVSDVGFPVVVKPDNGVGANRTYKLHDGQELDNFLTNRPVVPYFMEEFIDGYIQSFDGLVDQDGKPVFYTAHVFPEGIMEIVNKDLDSTYYSLREVPADLEDAGKRLLKAFDVRERFFHFEFFRTPDEELKALEVNMRPPGGLTVMMFNYANDIDIFRQYANVVVNNRYDALSTRPYHCAYIGRKYPQGYQLSHQQVLERYGHLIVQHEPISGVFSPALGIYGYLARSPELEEIEDAIVNILERGDPL